MADKAGTVLLNPTSMIVATSIVTFLSGFLFGVYSIRGYLIVSPALASERRSNIDDPVESDESDIDDDTILDHAPNWANGEDADKRDGLKMSKQRKPKNAKTDEKEDSSRPPLADAPANEECKLVLVVRTDLGMTKGKIAAQCSHATLACYKTLTKAASRNPSSPEAKLLQRWERRGQAKIAVQVKSEDELLELMGKARSLGITSEVIQDAGRTQIDPGSLTVLGVGPAPKSLVDQVTGGLKLL
ncbi:PTH2-domain-containing protein [Rostrohypoxylon terebratum]|nr:PTH2-domain-containing protein [Rostrohypoxylon terebratum]